MTEEKKTNGDATIKESIFLQYDGKEMPLENILSSIKEDYESIKKGEDPPVDIKVYLKPEDYKAYYVINNDFAGEVSLFGE